MKWHQREILENIEPVSLQREFWFKAEFVNRDSLRKLGALASYLVYNLKPAFSPTACVLRIVWGILHLQEREMCCSKLLCGISDRRFSLSANLVRATLAAEKIPRKLGGHSGFWLDALCEAGST